jgi:hypothetical protein
MPLAHFLWITLQTSIGKEVQISKHMDGNDSVRWGKVTYLYIYIGKLY